MNIVKIMIPTSMTVYLHSGDTAARDLKPWPDTVAATSSWAS